MPIIAGTYSLSGEPHVNRSNKIVQTMLRGCAQTSFYNNRNLHFGIGINEKEVDSNLLSKNITSGLCFTGGIHRSEDLQGKKSSDSVLDYLVNAKDMILHTKGKWLTGNVWGDYIIVIEDIEKSNLFIFRDPTGLNALFYTKKDQCIIFASELSALVSAIQDNLELDFEYLASYVIWGPHTTFRTPFKEVSELEPGMLIEISPSGLRSELCWNPIQYFDFHEQDKSINSFSIKELLQRVLACLTSEARGVYVDLSGGLDSSALLALLTKSKPSSSKLIATTVYYPSIASASELRYAREVSNFLHIDLVELNGEDYLPFKEILDSEKFRKWDRPSAQLLQLSLHEKHASIAGQFDCDLYINGFGGDQLFQARPTIPLYLCDYMSSLKFAELFSEVKSASKQMCVPFLSVMLNVFKYLVLHSTGYYDHFRWSYNPPNWCNEKMAQYAKREIFKPPFWDDLSKVTPAKSQQVLDIYDCSVQTDRGFRESYTRILHPFLSQPLVQIALAMPTKKLLSSNMDRIAFRKSMYNTVPNLILNRSEKGEHSGLYQFGLRSNFQEVEDLLMCGWLSTNNIVDKDNLRNDLRLACQGYTPNIWPLLNACTIELWLLAWGYR